MRLQLHGFTAFRDLTTVEFAGRRLFAITGPTGAGKSSLLDAMTWALFGRVPRVGARVGELIAQGEGQMSAVLDFETRGRHYRVARLHRRKGGSDIRLERVDADGEPQLLADKAGEVTEQVERILGMDYQTFTRTIVLPQNEFDQFLTGTPAEQRAILSRLMSLDVYEEARRIAGERAKTAEAKAKALEHHLATGSAATEEQVATLRREIVQAEAQLIALEARRRALADLGDRWRTFEVAAAAARTANEERHAAEVALAGARQSEQAARNLAARADVEVEALTTAIAALAYHPEERDRVRAAVARLEERERATEALAQARQDLDNAATQCALAATRAAEALRAHRATERAAAAATTKHEVALAVLHDAALAAEAARRARLLERETHLATAATATTEARRAQERAARLTSLITALGAADAGLKQAQAAEARAATAHQHATGAASAGAAAVAEATATALATQQRLDDARAHDMVAALTRGLRPGDPCPVCGEPLARVPASGRSPVAGAERALAAAVSRRDRAAEAHLRAETDRAAAESTLTSARDGLARGNVAVAEAEEALARESTSRSAVVHDLQAAERAATTAATAAQRANAAAETARDGAEAFALALAAISGTTLDPTLDLTTASLDGIAPARTPTALRQATEAADEAQSALQQAISQHDLAAQHAEAAQREVALREQGEREVRAHADAAAAAVDALPAVEQADRASLLAQRDELDRRAERADELTASVAQAREAKAAAAARLAEAGSQSVNAAEMYRERESTWQAAQDTCASLERTLANAWHPVLDAEPSKSALSAAMHEQQAQEAAANQRAAMLTTQLEQALREIEQTAQARADIAAHRAQSSLAAALAQELQSHKFIAFLLQERLWLLGEHAGVRLAQFSAGRYSLVAHDNGFDVIDHQNGDEPRSVRTLSGGETFLASLALALALSEHLPDISGTGGVITLESLFLDEGFGSLDTESLDLVVQGLEALAEEQRMVGIISHVPELAERIPDQIRVAKHAHASIVQDATA